MALRAEDLEVVVAVVVGAALVVDVVYFQVLGVAALGALVTVTRQDSFACGGGDVCGVVVLPHVAPPHFCALLRSWSGGLRPLVCSRHPAWTVVGEGLAVRLGAPVWLHSDCLLGNFPGRKTTKTPALAGVLSLALAYHMGG